MPIKNLGHYEGIVEDINIKSLRFKTLNPHHQELILLNRESLTLSDRIAEIKDRIAEIKSTIETEVNAGVIPWAWIWFKKSTRVKWKEEFVKACGQPRANAVVQSYKGKQYPQIGIQYVDPIPNTIKQIKPNPDKFPLIKHRLKHQLNK